MKKRDRKLIQDLVLAGNSDEIRELLLCSSHIEIVGLAKGGITASNLSALRSISIQHASTVLSNIYRKGYLKRFSRSATTGGIEHVYITPGYTKPD